MSAGKSLAVRFHVPWALSLAAGITLVAAGCASHRLGAVAPAPAIVSDNLRETLPNDYLRLSFVPPGVEVTTLSRPGALRAFTTATPLYSPPLTVAELPYYSGLVNDDQKVLVAMRCRPQQPEKVDAVLATWPNVFRAVERDVAPGSGACEKAPEDAAIRVACFAKAFNDSPSTAVPISLANTFAYAGRLFDASHTELAQWLQSNYGIYPAFAGTGYSVKDSYSLSTQPMTSQQILAKSVSSEYILKNVALTEAGCRCVAVAPYPGRSSDRLDPNFIAQAGGDGVCKPVARLRTTRRR